MTSLFGCSAKSEDKTTEERTTDVTIEEIVSDDTSASDEILDSDDNSSSTNSTSTGSYYKTNHLTKDDIDIEEAYEDNTDGTHAIEVDGETSTYSNIAVTKTGESDGDESDFYGANSAIFATDGATLTISNSYIETNGTHANAVFSYGEGTTVNISDSVIETSGNCSGGLMTTGGGTMNAANLTINTSGNSSAAIRSDRGGGTVNVDSGYYKTTGTGSPVIYSTADITVSNSYLESTASQGVVVEGKNSVTLNDCELVADNNTKNSDKSSTYQAVMIYQSMSGDADSGTSSFTMNGGTLTNANGDIFFVNNTACTIDLINATIINNDSEGVFLRAEAAGWGNDGSNGGKVIMTASNQEINGDMIVDEVSVLNLYLTEGSTFTGAINNDGTEGDVYVELTNGSTWTLTSDSYITGLTSDVDSIDLNGHTLYVGGEVYIAGSTSSGDAIEITGDSSSQSQPDGDMTSGGAPDGEASSGDGSDMGTPPDMPSDSGNDMGTPPEKPSDDNGGTPPEKPSNENGGTPPEKPGN